MSEYNIVAKIDPSGVSDGSNKVKQELRSIDAAASQTKSALDTAFLTKTIGALSLEIKALRGDFGTLATSISASATQMNTSLTAVAATSNRVAVATEAMTVAQKAQGAASSALNATIGSLVAGLGLTVPASLAATAGVEGVGVAATGTAVAVGVLEGVLTLGLSTAITVVTTLLTVFVGGLFSSSDASDAAAKGMKQFQDRQSDIGNFIDQTTGKLIRQNSILIQNAQLTQQSAIVTQRAKVSGLARSAFDAATNAASQTTYDAERRVGRTGSETTVDARVQQVITASGGDVRRLQAGLDALGPAYKKVADASRAYSAQTVFEAQNLNVLKGQQQDLNIAVKGGTVLTAAIVAQQADSIKAITGVSKAQLRLNELRREASDIDRNQTGSERQASLQRNLVLQQDAVRLIQSETQAVKDGRKEASEANKEKNKAAADARREASAAAALAKRNAAEGARRTEGEADFVRGIETQASTRGISGRVDTVNAQIKRALDDFYKRFNTAASPSQTAKITAALTDADAREIAARFDTAYNDPLKRLEALQGKTGTDRDVLNAQLAESDRLGRALLPTEKATIENSIRKSAALNEEASILDALAKPQEDYANRLAALNKLLKEGRISQVNYNAAVSDLGKGARSILNSGIGGRNSGRGINANKSFDQIGKEADENDRYAQEQKDTKDNRAELLKLGVDYDKLEEQQKKRHALNLQKIDDARKDQQLGSAQDIAGSLLQITEDTIGKNTALYKGLFVIEKAAAIARSIVAIQTGIAEASAEPFPLNLAAIASVVAATASIVSNISAVTLNLADGGLVRGPGGPRSDSVPINGSAGEFMVNAAAVAAPGNLAILEAMNSGALVTQTRSTTAQGAAQAAARGGGGRVMVVQHPGVAIETSENLTTGEVEIIAKRAVEKHAPGVVAADMNRPNSKTRKAVTRSTTARSKKA